jgi:hypothetical protein
MQRLVALAQIRLELHRGGLCFRPATKPDAIILVIVESLGIRYLAIFPVPPGTNRIDVLDVAFKLVGPRLRCPVFASD